KKLEYEFNIENADIEIQSLLEELSEKQVMKKSGYISDTDIADLNNQIFSKKKSKEIILRNLKKLMRGNDPKQIMDKESEIRTDSLSVELADSAYEILIGNKKGLKKGVQDRMDKIAKDISYCQSMIDDAEIKSPIDGIVIYGKTWITEGQREKVKIGINVFEGWPFMSISALDQMNILFKVNEVDISRIKKGMKVEFRLASNTEKLLNAEIIELGNVASVSEMDANEICNIPVKARIIEDSAKLNLKPGMSVNAEIILSEKKQVVAVPKEAVSSDGMVKMADGTLKKVDAGASNLFMREIISGISAGDTVLIRKNAAKNYAGEGARTESYKVVKASIANAIKEIGELVPENKTNVSVPFSGKINKIVEEGVDVVKGYEIALIDVKEKSDKLMEKELRAKVLEKERKLIEERSASEIRQIENALTVKEMDKKIAMLDYEILIAPLKYENDKDFQIAIKLCENSLKGVENEFKLKQEMAKKGYVSNSEIKKIGIRLNKSKADMSIAEYKYDYEKSLPLPNNVVKAQIELEKATLDFELTSLKLQKRHKKLEYDMEKNSIETKFNKSQLDETQKIVNQAKVSALMSGTVIYVSKWSNEGLRKIKEGDITRAKMTFMEIANLDKFYISGIIPEEQFTRIAASREVEFYLPASPDVRYKSKIRKVGLFAREKEEAGAFNERSEATGETPKFFDVEIETDAKNPKFQPGISVNFDIVIDSKKDVIKVPRKFLFRDDSGYYVIKSGGETARVETGIKSAEEAEIVSGLSEGDVIVY
ncbi:MAG TPA: HlyD family efflux transporter periplasmic adaptor subunit, partial [Candidatus Wallbacteria bacterium]|nr:HlyD family efflux transporter periplasmic adaptor subunit [Candidatus Wallbacteria bacterium]